jgi:hypothetical protein
MRSRLLTAVAALLIATACSKNAAPPNTSAPGTSALTPGALAPGAASDSPLFIAADLPLLPPGAQSGARSLTVIKAAYEFAARHPEVISYVPCFCGCERGGHTSNESCFVAGRRNGTVAWDNHGIGCEICVDVATETMQMHNAGATVAQIRQVIEKKYAHLYDGHTPTPPAPTTGRGGTQN